ncbi:hypothetical protein WICPIJ_000985 [Wickerhamomyces pijperi]|uniref:lipoyl(octanoyl) transferase n=1 Tax=Wickerhamomyces pijperi TaxID=599730 RepID=A0A9P8TR24_WICPI|nr:hypothetical protein WICPIJ_000985 [Wickerhamomyces pijperi]
MLQRFRTFHTAARLSQKSCGHSHSHSSEPTEQSTPIKCTSKFPPNKPSSRTLRHLHFTVPLPYSKGQLIQNSFSGAMLQFKKMTSTIQKKLKVLESSNQTMNEYEAQLLSSIIQMKPSPTVLTFQFQPIITAGKREKYRLTEDDIIKIKSVDQLDTKYDFVQTNRGGELSFHNPGQLVVYPIFDLKDFSNLTVKCFVSQLESAIISTLAKFDVKGIKTSNTGVWITEDVKISSLGLHVSRGVTSHGVSINVNNSIPELEKQTGFALCGLPGKTQTTISEIKGNGEVVKVDEVAAVFVRELAKSMGIERVESVDLEDLEIEVEEESSGCN